MRDKAYLGRRVSPGQKAHTSTARDRSFLVAIFTLSQSAFAGWRKKEPIEARVLTAVLGLTSVPYR